MIFRRHGHKQFSNQFFSSQQGLYIRFLRMKYQIVTVSLVRHIEKLDFVYKLKKTIWILKNILHLWAKLQRSSHLGKICLVGNQVLSNFVPGKLCFTHPIFLLQLLNLIPLVVINFSCVSYWILLVHLSPVMAVQLT